VYKTVVQHAILSPEKTPALPTAQGGPQITFKIFFKLSDIFSINKWQLYSNIDNESTSYDNI